MSATTGKNVVWDPKKMKENLRDKDVRKELFVEMCFFARLGYVQPPCCLHCLYQEAIEHSTTPNHDCERWVAFRKDTTIPLHPDFLADNIAFVPCSAVRKLLASDGGGAVNGFTFDAAQNRFRRVKNSVGAGGT